MNLRDALKMLKADMKKTGFDFLYDNTNPNLDPIQNNCKYGFVLPDRCRYNPRLGCDCGAYPAGRWDGEKYVPR